MVVLNTCCIRENADQRLYGTLEPPQGAGRRQARAADRRRRLPGPEGTASAFREKVGWADVVFGTHNLTSAPGLLRRAEDRGPRHGDPRRTGARVRSTIRCSAPERSVSCPMRRGSTSRPDATTPAPSASSPRCGGRRSAGPSTTSCPRVELLACRGVTRGDAARAKRQLLRAATSRSAAPSSPTCCVPSARWRASTGSVSSARTRRICAPTRSRRWPARRRSANSSTSPCNRGAIGCCAPCGGAPAPPRALPTRKAGRGARRHHRSGRVD